MADDKKIVNLSSIQKAEEALELALEYMDYFKTHTQIQPWIRTTNQDIETMEKALRSLDIELIPDVGME